MLRKPTREVIKQLLAKCHEQDFTYQGVGATVPEFPPEDRPPGYCWDEFSLELGSGKATYEHARKALQSWKMIPTSMVDFCWPSTPVETGSVVAVIVKVCGLWTFNPGRIVYTFDEGGEMEQFGLAYGTLPGHLEQGEEQFRVCWDHATDQVRFHITVFSRPSHWLAWLGYPLARREQARFRRLSGAAMQQALDGQAT